MIVIACALLWASPVAAQNLQQEARPAAAGSQSVTVIIERKQLRFAVLSSAQEVKLEVFNQPEEKSLNWARIPEMMRQAKSQLPEQ